ARRATRPDARTCRQPDARRRAPDPEAWHEAAKRAMAACAVGLAGCCGKGKPGKTSHTMCLGPRPDPALALTSLGGMGQKGSLMERVPMTPAGQEKLKQLLAKLREERPKISKEIEVAREHGDLKENAEYHAAKERQGMV